MSGAGQDHMCAEAVGSTTAVALPAAQYSILLLPQLLTLNCCRMPPGQSSRSVAPISGSSSSTRWRLTPACHARVHAATACDTVS